MCQLKDQITSSKYTYVVALGHKESNHDEINLTHNKQLQQLAQYTYCYFGASHVRHNIPVVVETIEILAYIPESYTINNIMNHESCRYLCKKWGYAAF